MGVTRTVGSGRDHTTIQDALDYFSAYDFSSNGGQECYIDIYPEGGGTNGEWVITAQLTAPNNTTNASATDHLVIRAATGYGFADHQDKETNALRYNNATGVAISQTTSGIVCLRADVNHLHIRGLQFRNPSGSTADVVYINNANVAYTTFSGNIILGGGNCNCLNISNTTIGAHTIVNNLFYKGRVLFGAKGADVVCNNTQYVASGTSVGINGSAGNYLAANCIAYASGNSDFTIGGGTYVTSGIGSGNCASGDGTGPATNLVVITPADAYVSLTSNSEDFRIKATATSLHSGGREATSVNGDVDIFGRQRNASTPTIGCWEYSSGGVTVYSQGQTTKPKFFGFTPGFGS